MQGLLLVWRECLFAGICADNDEALSDLPQQALRNHGTRASYGASRADQTCHVITMSKITEMFQKLQRSIFKILFYFIFFFFFCFFNLGPIPLYLLLLGILPPPSHTHPQQLK